MLQRGTPELEIKLDMVFELALIGKVVNEPEEYDPFADRPEARQVVKALKIIKASRAHGFKDLRGCALENLVLWQARLQQQEMQEQQQQQEQQEHGRDEQSTGTFQPSRGAALA